MKLFWKGQPIESLPIEVLLEIIRKLSAENDKLRNPTIDLAQTHRKKRPLK